MQQKCLHIVTRKIAITHGFKRYCTHKLCKRGHFEESSVHGSSCIECKRIVQQDWQSNNQDKVAARRLEQKENGYWIQYHKDNREKKIEASRKWCLENPERLADKKERERPAKRIHDKKYYDGNKDKFLEHSRNRRARKAGADGAYSADDISRIYRLQKGKCAACKKTVADFYHVDHIVPLCRGGSNWPENLQILCPKCNLKKSGKDPFAWANQNGRLL